MAEGEDEVVKIFGIEVFIDVQIQEDEVGPVISKLLRDDCGGGCHC